MVYSHLKDGEAQQFVQVTQLHILHSLVVLLGACFLLSTHFSINDVFLKHLHQ